MDTKVIDVNDLLERVQDDKELLLELLDIYVMDFEEKRKHLDNIVQTDDYDGLKSIAHSLKGASGNISATPIREIFLKCEELAEGEKMDSIKELLGELDTQFGNLKEDVVNIKQEFSS